jgi:hypothetical protein
VRGSTACHPQVARCSCARRVGVCSCAPCSCADCSRLSAQPSSSCSRIGRGRGATMHLLVLPVRVPWQLLLQDFSHTRTSTHTHTHTHSHPHSHTHTHARARTHARTHARAHRSLISSTFYVSLCSHACQLDMVLVLTNQQQRAPSSSLLRCVCKQHQRATRQPLTFLRRTSLGPSRCSARLSRHSHQTTIASSRIFAFLRACQTLRTR